MEVDLSNKELKAASIACAVAAEIARIRQGKASGADWLLADFTAKELDEFIRICRELKEEFDHPHLSAAELSRETGSIILDGVLISTRDRRNWREERGKYSDAK